MELSYLRTFKIKVSSVIKEWYGTNYLLFTTGRILISMTILFYASIFSFFYRSEIINATNNISSDIYFELLKEYLVGLKISSILIVSYFLTFQWSNIHRNGDYGYWISLGVKREKFYFTTALFFITLIFVNVIFSYALLRILGGLEFSFVDDIVILSTIFASLVLIIGIAWVVSELVKKPELSSVIFLLFYGFVFQYNQNQNNLVSDILFAETQLKDYDLFLHFVSPILLGLGLIYVGYNLNKRREIEI